MNGGPTTAAFVDAQPPSLCARIKPVYPPQEMACFFVVGSVLLSVELGITRFGACVRGCVRFGGFIRHSFVDFSCNTALLTERFHERISCVLYLSCGIFRRSFNRRDPYMAAQLEATKRDSMKSLQSDEQRRFDRLGYTVRCFCSHFVVSLCDASLLYTSHDLH